MIKVNVMYPSGSEINFDVDYYMKEHMPLVRRLLGEALKNDIVEKGLMGATAEDQPPYIVSTSMFFDTTKDFGKAFGPHAKEIMADLSNFTNAQPVMQISEVLS